MCTYLTHNSEVSGSAYNGSDWIVVRRAVVSFDHPVRADVEHALCIDLRAGDDPAARLAVELDAISARHLAESILALLDSEEVRALQPST
jgi:hypothetical protein